MLSDVTTSWEKQSIHSSTIHWELDKTWKMQIIHLKTDKKIILREYVILFYILLLKIVQSSTAS